MLSKALQRYRARDGIFLHAAYFCLLYQYQRLLSVKKISTGVGNRRGYHMSSRNGSDQLFALVYQRLSLRSSYNCLSTYGDRISYACNQSQSSVWRSGGFDGYHLATAITGIYNLRSRLFLFYLQLLKFEPLDEEDNYVRWSLAIYAPLSLIYVLFVFSFLVWSIGSWIWLNLSAIAFTLLAIWAIYYYFIPTSDSKQL